MGHRVKTFNNRIDWLNNRCIGGSSAASILGLSKYKSSRDLYYELVERKEITEDVQNEVQEYGSKAEEHITSLFELEHPQYEVIKPNPESIEIWTHKDYEWMTATLDGQLIERETGKTGILEIKTMLVNQHNKDDWKGGNIPDQYYTQVLHYMLVEPEFEFAVIHCRQRKIDPETKLLNIYETEYRIERKDVQDDINNLEQKEKEFWHYVETKQIPPLVINI